MNTRPIDISDISNILKITSGTFPACYNITEESLRRCVFSSPTYDSRLSRCIIDGDGSMLGFIVIKISNETEVYPDYAWISILAVDSKAQKKGIGKKLLMDSIGALRDMGIKALRLAGDYENFFSGIPAPEDYKVRFFKAFGFEVSDEEHYDMEGDVRDNSALISYKPAFEGDYQVTSYDGDREGLLGFIKKEFSLRWHFEVASALDKGRNPREINIMRDPGGKICGFCVIRIRPDGLSGLGPIGIAENIQRKGLGEYLLWSGLMKLGEFGAGTVNIDWTTLTGFYGRFGFSPARCYKGGYLDL